MNDEKNPNKKHKTIELSKKNIIIVILIVIVVFIVGILILKEPTKKNYGKYTVKTENPVVIYMDEPIDIPITIKGSKEYLEEVMTYISPRTGDIVEIPDDILSGNKDTILINPISAGEDTIDIVSSIGVDKYTQIVAKQKIHVIVCPKFDSSLLQEREFTITNNTSSSIKLNFNNKKCYKYITFQSDNENIASVDDNGVITAINKGKTAITIDNGTKTINLIVNVI